MAAIRSRGMSVSVEIGLLLAVLTAFGSVAGFLYKFRGAREAPAVDLRRPLASSVALFRSPLYTLGIVIALGSWGLHVGALSLAPISLVQSVIAGGLVLLTVVADRLFGIAVTRREWIGVGLTAAGLAFLAATLSGVGHSAQSHYHPAHAGDLRRRGGGCRSAARRPVEESDRAGGLGRPPMGGLGHLDQGPQLASRQARDRRAGASARIRDPRRLAARTAHLRPQSPARGSGARDRAHERRGEPDDDRRRADRVRRAASVRDISSSP